MAFRQWRLNFYPSDDQTARKHFANIKRWLEIVFRAAAKPRLAGNRDRLPAVFQSLVDWPDHIRILFKLEAEIDDILEDEPHYFVEAAYPVSYIKKPDNLDRLKHELTSYGYHLTEIKKHIKKAKPDDWITLQVESRPSWDPFNSHQSIPCETRNLPPNPQFKLADGQEFLERQGFTKEQSLLFLKLNRRKHSKSTDVRII